MAVEICPIRPINLGGQLGHLEENIVSRRRNIVEYGTKQSFQINIRYRGTKSGAVGDAGHDSLVSSSQSWAAPPAHRLLELGRHRREQRRIGPPAAKPQAFIHC